MKNFYPTIKISNELFIYVILKEINTINTTNKFSMTLEHQLHYYKVCIDVK